MKYIPKFKFTIESRRMAAGPSLVQNKLKKDVSRIIPELKKDETYEIFSIRPILEKGEVKSVIYTFLSERDRKLTSVTFDSIQDAEKRIGVIVGDPD